MAKPTIWITGAGGMLGRSLLIVLKKDHRFQQTTILTSGSEVDISNAEAVQAFANEHLLSHSTVWIVNCAAYTAVDKAEEELEQAMAVNGDGAANLAAIAASIGANLIHVSTDYVFDGTLDRPYVETDKVNPQSVYGRSKLAGEQTLQERWDRHYIVRTSWLYSPFGKNFVLTMLRLLAERPELKIVADQRGAPTYTMDLAHFLAEIILQKPPYGVYHFANQGDTTWFDFTGAILSQAQEAGLLDTKSQPKLSKVTTEDYGAPAPRPANSVFNLTKAQTIMPNIPEWPDALQRCLQFIRDNPNE